MEEEQDLRSLFANFVISSGKLQDLKKLSSELDSQIQDSHSFIREIRTKWNSLNGNTEIEFQDHDRDDVSRHEDITKFLEAGPPKLLLPDMENLYHLYLDKTKTIENLLKALHHLKSKISKQTLPINCNVNNFNPSEMDLFSSSLQQFCDRFSKLKSIEYDPEKRKNEILEDKLQCFYEDVTSLTKMIQSSVSISECNEEWSKNHPESKELSYTEVFKNLLDSINELTFMFLEVRKC